MPHSTYLPERMGTAEISPTGKFEAGSFQSFTLVYTAGYFGIDDTGSLKVVTRFATDMGKPQFSDPKAPNYCSVEASNNALLEVRYDTKGNVRPWFKTIRIDVLRGFPKLRMCVAYDTADGRIDTVPATASGLAAAKPVFRDFPGFDEDISGVRAMSDLPANARRFVEAISAEAGAPITLVSVGASREQVILPDATA